MKSIPELINYIRFQLSQLRLQNKHHEFEHLTRHFARLRICENILPATGPVAAGGDQGRDFETYRTYLSSTPIATSTFLSLFQDKKLVFACSLSQDIIPKIKADIATICSGQQKVDQVFYFCEAEIPVGRRHELQDWAQEHFQVNLEVFDGQSLSEQLTDLDVFWIAEEFLEIPSNFYPRSEPLGSKYEEFKQRWLIQNECPYSYSDFFQVKYGIRRATFEKDAKPDLLNWIKKMEVYLDHSTHSILRRRAIYEICVASLRGLNNLTEKKNLVEEYFSQIKELDNLSDLFDTTVLLSYCSSAFFYHHFNIEEEKLFEWSKALITKIETALDEDIGPGTKCQLLQIRGYAAFLPFRPGISLEVAFGECFEWWSRLLTEIDKAPLFPLESFADFLTNIAQFVGEDERFIELTQKTDELLEKRSSGYIAAEKCRDRAMVYFNKNNFLIAIKQLQNAKIKWFTAETIRGALLSMLILSECYQRIGFIYPAKYYASGVAFLTIHHENEKIKNLIPRSLFQLANCCYAGGEWLNFAHIIRIALVTHYMFDDQPLDIVNNEELQILFAHAVIIQAITNKYDKSLEEAFNKIYSTWPIDDSLRDDLRVLRKEHSGTWEKMSVKDLWEIAQTQLSGRPFPDVGGERTISWKALGINWKIIFKNDYITNIISEEFVSILQIILADIANKDLALLPTNVCIYVYVTNELNIDLRELPDNEVATWRIGFPRKWIGNKEFLEDLKVDILSIAFTILENCSVLSYDNLKIEWDKTFSEGITSKTFNVRSYSELYLEFLEEDHFNLPYRGSLLFLLPHMEFKSQEYDLLKWVDEDGPGYSEELAKKIVINRYENAIKPIRYTLQRLLGNEDFRYQINRLKKEGYLDWQILLLIFNITLNYKLNQLITRDTPLDKRNQIYESLISSEEEENDVEVSPSLFTQEIFEFQWKFQLGAIAKTWGLELRQKTPDFKALERFLDVRYHNSEIDVDHNDIFEISSM